MEKIKLKNGQEFELVPMGINTNEFTKRRIFKFKSNLTYTDVLAMFLEYENIEKIDYILADGTVGKTYLDCVKLMHFGFSPNYEVDVNTTADIFIVELSVDSFEKKLKEMNSNLDDLANTVVMVSMQ
jgi:hypothetical protein